jgi:hypothetical protein
MLDPCIGEAQAADLGYVVGCTGREARSRRGLGTVTDLLLRQAQAGRAGAQGANDYDVIGPDGIVIGRIFKATTSPVGTPWLWTLAYGDHEDRTLTHGI